MCDLSQHSNFETDNLEADFSMLNTRLNSFRGSGLAQQVPAEKLARAGFYFTGYADRVRCFSCQKTVENWSREDTPVERHKEVSPLCTFLSCVHRTGYNLDPFYNEEAEDTEYRLRTGEVVDESTYPMAPHMRSEETRLQTFSSWPAAAPVRPRDLAQAGLFYLGESDKVQCFCCAGMLGGWEEGDIAWGEHTKHFPNCFFILGHDVGNIPFQGEEESGSRQHRNTHVLLESFEGRLNTFTGVQHPIDHERLARAGFYSTGSGDMVLCFHCGGALTNWQPDEDPWEEHAKYYPGCSFVMAEKGPEFVNSIQLQNPPRNRPTTSHQNGFSAHGNDVLQSAVAQMAMEMGVESSTVEKIILEKISQTGSGYSSVEALVEDCFNNTQESNAASEHEKDEDPMEALHRLQREKQCKICMDRDIAVVFIPCGHLVSCERCSKSLTKCPICCGSIQQKIKTYVS